VDPQASIEEGVAQKEGAAANSPDDAQQSKGTCSEDAEECWSKGCVRLRGEM